MFTTRVRFASVLIDNITDYLCCTWHVITGWFCLLSRFIDCQDEGVHWEMLERWLPQFNPSRTYWTETLGGLWIQCFLYDGTWHFSWVSTVRGKTGKLEDFSCNKINLYCHKIVIVLVRPWELNIMNLQFWRLKQICF